MTVQVHAAAPAHPVGTSTPKDERLVGRVMRFASLATVLMVMARVTMHAADALDNTDTWFHLTLGQDFLGGWSLGHPGHLSSFARSTWVPTQWSTEILTAKVDDWFGLPGVAWMYGVLYLVLIVGVFLLCRAHGDLLPSSVAAAVCVIAAGTSLSARPQVVSLILVTATVGAWHRAARTGRPPWWLVPMTWVWATAHGLWTAGVVIGLVTALGIVLDRKVGAKRALQLLAVPVLSVVAACATPVGPALLTSQLAVGARTSMIAEWGATSFRSPGPFLVACLVGVVVLVWARRGGVGWTDLLQLAVAAWWILLVSRMVPFGAILVAPLFVTAVTGTLPPRSRSEPVGRGERVVLIGGALLCVVGLTLAVPHTADEPAGVPTAFSGRLGELADGSTVLVEDGTGAWIEYAFPGVDPVIDGMLDAYPVDYIRQFYDFKKVVPGWQNFVTRSRARDAVLLEGSPVSAALQHQLGWTVVQKDRDWLYLEAPESP